MKRRNFLKALLASPLLCKGLGASEVKEEVLEATGRLTGPLRWVPCSKAEYKASGGMAVKEGDAIFYLKNIPARERCREPQGPNEGTPVRTS